MKTSVEFEQNKVGLAFAALLGGWHLLWALLVLTNAAQPLIDFIFWAHMIRPIYIIAPFNPPAALTLLIVTSLSGYLFGSIGAFVWNRIHRDSTHENRPQIKPT